MFEFRVLFLRIRLHILQVLLATLDKLTIKDFKCTIYYKQLLEECTRSMFWLGYFFFPKKIKNKNNIF